MRTSGNSTDRRRLPGSGSNCPAGMLDMTDGNWNWWQCATLRGRPLHGCTMPLRLPVRERQPGLPIGSDGPCVDSDATMTTVARTMIGTITMTTTARTRRRTQTRTRTTTGTITTMQACLSWTTVASETQWRRPADATAAEATYGSSRRDTSGVTDMSGLFCGKPGDRCCELHHGRGFFNDDISGILG